MKCMMSRRRALPSDVRTAAINVAKQMLDEQSDRISARCYNEVCIAMLQCNLSHRTIDRVQNVLKEAVLPKLDELYTPDNKRDFDNRQNIADADLWVKDYLQSHGVRPFATAQEETP